METKLIYTYLHIDFDMNNISLKGELNHEYILPFMCPKCSVSLPHKTRVLEIDFLNIQTLLRLTYYVFTLTANFKVIRSGNFKPPI